MKRALLAVAMACASVTAIAEENWPQFRGLRAGVAPDSPSLPDEWSQTKNVVWKVDVPGRSWSSPVVWGDHVFVTTAYGKTLFEPLRPVADYKGLSWDGWMDGNYVTKSSEVHRWVLYDFDFKTGTLLLGRRATNLSSGLTRTSGPNSRRPLSLATTTTRCWIAGS